jgi:hypothetical protein
MRRAISLSLCGPKYRSRLDRLSPMEETMQGIHVSDSHQSLVTAVFKDIALSFELPQGATLEDLAGYLADLGELHGGKPLAIDIKLLC